MRTPSLYSPGAGGVKVPLQRTEKLLRSRPLTGTTLSQLKLMLRSVRVSTGWPLKSGELKYSPVSPSPEPLAGCSAVCAIGTANPSTRVDPWAYVTFAEENRFSIPARGNTGDGGGPL